MSFIQGEHQADHKQDRLLFIMSSRQISVTRTFPLYVTRPTSLACYIQREENAEDAERKTMNNAP